jgi:hypothetical protein
MLSPRSTSEKRWRAGLYGHRARENAGLDRRRKRMDRAGAHRAGRPPELPEPFRKYCDREASARPGQRFLLGANMVLGNIRAFGPAGG